MNARTSTVRGGVRAAALAGALLLAAAGGAHAQSETGIIAITGGTVFPVSSPRIERGTILVRDGRIVAVGTDVAVPEGATVIDASGRWVTPGLFHAASDLGLTGISSIDETTENRVTDTIAASFDVVEGIDPAAISIPVARLMGITTTVTGPTGGLIAGRAALIDLLGPSVDSMVGVPRIAMVADLSESSKEAGGGSRAGVTERLRQVLRDAQEYARAGTAMRRLPMEGVSASAADLEALRPVVEGRMPLFVRANRRSDLENVLRLRRDFPRLRPIVLGGAEGWKVAPQLAAAGVPVAVETLRDVPTFDALGARLDNATLLREAGVNVMFVPEVREIRQAAGNAVRNGMSWDDALRAVTLAPAEAFGVADRYGSLAAGRVADIVVWSGDPFEFSSRPEQIIIRGVQAPLDSRMTELRDRYRTLPPAY